MGAAFSSNKRFSLRSILPVILVVLVLVGGAVACSLHQHNSAAVVVNDRRNSMIKSRKILRDDRGHQRPRRRPSSPAPTVSPALPKGIVHETTNLEMEASLAGNPKQQRKNPQEQQQRKSLLAVPVGIKNKNVVDKLVSKFPSSDFTVMLFHYDGATKLWFAKRFLHPDVVDDYDYIFLWDEDIEVDAFDPARYLAVVRREGLEVSQPALDRASEIHHAHTARRLAGPNNPEPTDVHRGAGWVEVMVPVLSRKAWRCAWGMLQNDLIHGWGLDYKLGYCAGEDRVKNVGVVDSEYVLHRGVPVLGGDSGSGNSAGRAAVRRRSFKEMQIFEKRWNAAVAQDKDWTDPYAAPQATGGGVSS
ncbi:hypothetical protein PR202_ga28217 [Eleusine coracana subsp. coracana]|uniref:Uncharacterized protein n=1 Tax=Eleusine coracana subsp. coracana TaxID=191504 RepID=A0AAV5DJQ8_ELECO|nr:hypothetical protein PR202_ga28217 [Eleusine coracana subsp. coracana]